MHSARRSVALPLVRVLVALGVAWLAVSCESGSLQPPVSPARLAYTGPGPAASGPLNVQAVDPRPRIFDPITSENLPELERFLQFRLPSVDQLQVAYDASSLRWSTDGSRLVFDSDAGPLVYAASTLERLDLEPAEAQLHALASSAFHYVSQPDGFQITGAGGEVLAEGMVRFPPVADVIFSGDGSRAAIIDNGERVYIYELDTGTQRSVFVQIRVTAATLNYDGSIFAGVTSGGTVQFYDADRGTPIRGLTPPFGSRIGLPVAISPDKSRAAFKLGQDLVLYDLATGSTVRTFERALLPRGLVFSPDGGALAGFQGRALWVWDVATGLVKVTQGTGSISCLVSSPDGQRLLVGDVTPTSWIYSWQQAGEEIVPRLESTFRSSAACPVFSADGQSLAFASPGPDGRYNIHLVRTSNWRQSLQFSILAERSPDVALSPDGSVVALATGQAAIGLFSSQDGRSVGQKRFPTEAFSVAFGPQGTLYAAGRNFIVKWPSIDDNQSESVQISDVGFNRSLGTAYHSATGEYWISRTGATNGRVWNMASLEGLGTTTFALSGKRHIIFSPGGELLVTVTNNNIDFYDPLTAAQLLRMPIDLTGNRVAIGTNGDWLALGSSSNEVRLYAVEAPGPAR